MVYLKCIHQRYYYGLAIFSSLPIHTNLQNIWYTTYHHCLATPLSVSRLQMSLQHSFLIRQHLMIKSSFFSMQHLCSQVHLGWSVAQSRLSNKPTLDSYTDLSSHVLQFYCNAAYLDF